MANCPDYPYRTGAFHKELLVCDLYIFGGVTFDSAATGIASGEMKATDGNGIDIHNQAGTFCKI